MRYFLSIFLCCLIISCNTKGKRPAEVSANTEESVAADTVIAPYSARNRTEDSLQAIQERDSFYRIRPLKQFISDDKGSDIDKLAAVFIDTSTLTWSAMNVRDTEIVKYNKEQLPISRKFVYRQKDFSVQMNDDCYDYCPRKIFINNKRMRPGIELDTSISGDWFITNIILDKEKFYSVSVGDRSFFVAGGYVEQCNGMACGVNYFLLYDIQNKKTIVYHQFRSDKFRAGFNAKTGELEVFVVDDGDYSGLFECVFNSGRVFRITKNGIVKEAINDAGKPLYYKGYTPTTNVGTLNIMEGNFRN